jgi:ATP-dependent DNA ligase
MLRLFRWCRLGARRYRVISSCPKMVTSVTERPFRMGLEGIVSKRVDAAYRSGPSKTWVKTKNPESAAVRRESEEEWR